MKDLPAADLQTLLEHGRYEKRRRYVRGALEGIIE